MVSQIDLISANNGNKLHIVKLQRNNLAHGNVSFLPNVAEHIQPKKLKLLKMKLYYF